MRCGCMPRVKKRVLAMVEREQAVVRCRQAEIERDRERLAEMRRALELRSELLADLEAKVAAYLSILQQLVDKLENR
jgi:hypothetical protein